MLAHPAPPCLFFAKTRIKLRVAAQLRENDLHAFSLALLLDQFMIYFLIAMQGVCLLLATYLREND